MITDDESGEDFVTIENAGRMAGVSSGTIRNRIRKGQMRWYEDEASGRRYIAVAEVRRVFGLGEPPEVDAGGDAA